MRSMHKFMFMTCMLLLVEDDFRVALAFWNVYTFLKRNQTETEICM